MDPLMHTHTQHFALHSQQKHSMKKWWCELAQLIRVSCHMDPLGRYLIPPVLTTQIQHQARNHRASTAFPVAIGLQHMWLTLMISTSVRHHNQ